MGLVSLTVMEKTVGDMPEAIWTGPEKKEAVERGRQGASKEERATLWALGQKWNSTWEFVLVGIRYQDTDVMGTYSLANGDGHRLRVECEAILSDLDDVDTWDGTICLGRGNWRGGGASLGAVVVSHDGWEEREKSEVLHVDEIGLCKK
jgi:hypothetical protein